MGDIPVVRQRPGVIVSTGATVQVNVGGVVVPAWLPAGYIPTVGDAVKVSVVNGRAVVLGPVILSPRPLTGTVQGAAGGGTVPVTTDVGVVSCRYTGTAPSVGVLVRLDWQSTTPWVWPSTVAPVTPPATEPEPGVVPPPPPVITTGTLYATAVTAGARTASTGWSNVYPTQGTSGSLVWSGAWFYGTRPSQIRGRIVTRCLMWLPARRFSTPFTVNLYRHTSNTRPAGDVSRVAGPSSFSSSSVGRWVTLSTAWGQAIVDSGGGIGMYGGTFGGLMSLAGDARSGQLRFDWSR